MPKLDRILETAIYVDDLDRAARFYETVLQLPPLLKMERLYAYDVGGASVLLVFKRGASAQDMTSPVGTIPGHDAVGRIHVAFAIGADELADWEARLAVHDVAVEGRTHWQAGGDSVYFRDPDGHMLEFATPGLWRTY
ncbi:VOC family protein [Labrys sp. KB_33_2]|uniref:VOC family protein n=1 Tax=unclassified Labrys (in: a-proteobacteria) TaxID=2688601 RepID=UPI003EBC143F